MCLSLVWTGPPGPPGGLLVKNVAETSVELRWSRGYDNHSPIGKYVIMGRSPLSSEWRKMRTGVSLTPEQKYSCCASSNNKKHSNNTMITQMQQNDFMLTEFLSSVVRCQTDVGVSALSSHSCSETRSVAHTLSNIIIHNSVYCIHHLSDLVDNTLTCLSGQFKCMQPWITYSHIQTLYILR